MNDEPKRLILEDADFARLASVSDRHEPAPEQVTKALAQMTRVAMTPRSSGWRLLAPGLALGVALGLAITATSLDLVGRSASTTAPPVAAISSADPRDPGPSAPGPSAPGADRPTKAPERSVSVNDLAEAAPPVNVAPREVPGANRANAAPAPAPVRSAKHESTSTFDEELALVSTARSSLEAANLAACLGAVDRYQERFRSGLFAQEIEVIRIDALAASGQRAQARRLAERFLSANRQSPYVDRVRSVALRVED